MECVSSLPLATQGYGIGGGQTSWTFNSSHAALWDCMSQWTFGKGTATSEGHRFYFESPPISPRSGPTQLGISVPDLNLEEEVEDSAINADHVDTAESLEDNKLDLSNERTSDRPGPLLSSPSVGARGALQGNRFPLVTENPMDCSENSLPPLQLDSPSTSQNSDADDSFTPQKLSERASGQTGSIEATQAPQGPGELDPIVHELGEGDRDAHSIMLHASPQTCRPGTSITESTRESNGGGSEVLADEDDPCARRDPGAILRAGDTTGDQVSISDNHQTLKSPVPRPQRKSRVRKRPRRPWLPKEIWENKTNTPKYERRMRVDKRRRADFGKRHSRLHRSHSADAGITPEQPSDSDHSDSENTFWTERKSRSISGLATTTEVTSSHLSGHPAAMPSDQLPSDAGPLPDETSAASLSSCDETEMDVSDMEQPHPLDPQRDQIVNLLLQRYIAYRTEGQRKLEDTESRSNGTGSASKASGRRPHSKTNGATQAAGQKRKRNSSSQDDDSVEDDDEASPKRRKRPKGTAGDSSEHPSFACPFSKKSPSKYRRCYRYDLKRIRDVKQHLRRCHRRAVYCPVCSQTFETEEARDAHVRQRSCLESPGFTVDGLSEVQAQSLSGKCSTKALPSEQWFHVFDICFPGHAHPRSPYVDRNLSEELQSFRDYASTEGPSIILEEMRGFRDLNEQDTAFLRQVLSDGLERIADQWSQGLDSESTPELGNPASATTVPRPSPQSSSARQLTPPHVSRPARDIVGGDASASPMGSMQQQLLGISSGDKLQNGVATQADSSMYDFGAELFDFSMLSSGAPAAAAPGDVEYPLDLWTLRYGPNVELTT